MLGARYLKIILMVVVTVGLAGCATPAPPRQPHNLCSIFKEKPSWYRAAKKANKRWGTPIQVMMAIMYQESSYRHDVRPPRPWFLFIPLPRNSSAYGYAQAQDGTWDMYLKEVNPWFASRDDFEDAIDFIGWYTHKTREKNGVSLWHADKLYLNYHEGWGGYARGTHHRKKWLLSVANKVKWRAGEYGEQLRRCSL
ncbi:transglycosylase SLT domain-containing protein [Sansalvadorimonas verongulae]|uniref:transglycosylase SLT domain-containing protein n=1 Tax=Sansalvadorimonas verongulae TaxID=2172824 RepID=UPI0012BD0A96|nr:hypothetical protein [Sansalvadorimonas verongulae]MTI13780.1 hypothetical protein [Sansalvadorimonas verongulae]